MPYLVRQLPGPSQQTISVCQAACFRLNVNRHIALLNAVFRVTNCNGERRTQSGGKPASAPAAMTVRCERNIRTPFCKGFTFPNTSPLLTFTFARLFEISIRTVMWVFSGWFEKLWTSVSFLFSKYRDSCKMFLSLCLVIWSAFAPALAQGELNNAYCFLLGIVRKTRVLATSGVRGWK